MVKLTQKWCLVSLLENVSVGYEFDKDHYPLHVTLADVHDANWKNPALISGLEHIASNQKPFNVKSLQIGELGPVENPTRVTFIEMNDELANLHNNLVTFLENNNGKFNNPEYQKKGFIAHSTVQKNSKVAEDSTIEINNIALIDMFPAGDGNRRKIVKIIDLN